MPKTHKIKNSKLQIAEQTLNTRKASVMPQGQSGDVQIQ